MMMRKAVLALALAVVSTAAAAGVSRDLPYPNKRDGFTGDELAAQVYFVNHFFAFKNIGIVRADNGAITHILNKEAGEPAPKVIEIERHLNNDYTGGDIKARDMALFHSGKLKGTGMLITDYVDDAKSQSYMIWIPALRKIRRFAQPDKLDAYGGTVFTFDDVLLRKPEEETHEIQGREEFKGCLGSIDLSNAGELPESIRKRQAACRHDGKPVYLLKSTPKRENWPYDYRVSYVDVRSFADYRTRYYKGGKEIKVIDRDWGLLPGEKQLADARALYWRYWYGKDLETGYETWAVVPFETFVYDQSRDSNFWSEDTLTRFKQ